MASKPLPIKRIPEDVVKLVEDEQRPRETFGETLRRMLEEATNKRRSGNGSRPTSTAS